MRIILIALLCYLQLTLHTADQLNIVCTVPDLADMVKHIGGDAVKVTSFARPGDNPHFVSARPSFIRKLANADAFVIIGMDLEVGWAPALLNSARNQRVRPGKPGYIDCSAAINALEIPKNDIDRSAGDVHPHGNPHYLLSPICGMQVIHYLGERLALLDPTRAETFRKQAQTYKKSLAEALYGKDLTSAHDVDKLIAWHEKGQLLDHIDKSQLGGWMADIQSLGQVSLIDDHKQWPYLAACYQLKIIAHLEPKAGVPPTSKHLQEVIALAKQTQAKGIITSPWFDPRHAKIVSDATSLPTIMLAHQAGSIKGSETYQKLCAANVAALKKLSQKQ